MGAGNCFISTLFWVGRSVLFAYSALLLITQIYSMFFDENNSAPTGSTLLVYAYYFKGGLKIAAALIGVHACYTAKPHHLRSFAIILLGMAALAAATAYARHATRDLDEAAFAMGLVHTQPFYVWYHPGANSNTQVWDMLQADLKCCGVKGPSDWEPLRPSDLKKNVLPRSCCPSKLDAVWAQLKQCTTKDAFEVGCVESHKQMGNRDIAAKVFAAVRSLLLMALALCVASFAGRRPLVTPDQYARFDGSVYVRQPQYQQQQPRAYLQPTGNQKPPAYVAASAPPSYGLA